jgi:hypothetical protein
MRSFTSICSLFLHDDRPLVLIASLFLAVMVTSAASASVEDKRAGFMGMRGKKDVLRPQSLFDLYTMPAVGEETEEDYLVEPVAQEVEKRQKSGFVGMRGKKSDEMDPAELDYPGFYYLPKRAGFMGMRGKKDYNRY